MINAFSLLKTLQVGGVFFGVPRIYDRDCTFTTISVHIHWKERGHFRVETKKSRSELSSLLRKVRF